MKQEQNPAPGWNPWPWVPVFILSVVVVANIVLIGLAHTIEDGLVYDDWYERGLRYDESAPAQPAAPAEPDSSGQASQ